MFRVSDFCLSACLFTDRLTCRFAQGYDLSRLCRDYITEKAYRAFSYDVLPIVLGSGNYSALLPPNSFINVADFDTPKKLAKLLRFLSDNPDEYEKYFAWKHLPEHSRVPDAYRRDRTDIGKLCEIINREGSPSVAPSVGSAYRDLHDWWVTQAQCYTPLFSSSPRRTSLFARVSGLFWL